MRQSELFVKTQKNAPKDEESKNARFLEQAGFIQKLAAGIYAFLPLGLLVLNKIESIVREEMNKAGGIEILMPSLHPKENWASTGRWQSFDALFKTKSNFGSEYALGPTHEEVLYPLLTHYVSSYKDLPLAIYQIQTKFRDEKRPKSGLLRTREFRMKDLYSFHANEEGRDGYYEIMKKSYLSIFKKLDLDAIPTVASGGTFSEKSLEFQALSPAGEDTIYFCKKCNLATNKELIGSPDAQKCQNCGGSTDAKKAIEVGNIFPLKEKYAKDFNLGFKDKNGALKLVSAGCYGLGTSRIMGAIAEIHSDENGLVWPESVAPFLIHLVALGESEKPKKATDKFYDDLIAKGMQVLYDDRDDKTAGEKFADADLIGIPLRAVIGEKTLAQDSVEIKKRDSSEIKLVETSKFYSYIRNNS